MSEFIKMADYAGGEQLDGEIGNVVALSVGEAKVFAGRIENPDQPNAALRAAFERADFGDVHPSDYLRVAIAILLSRAEFDRAAMAANLAYVVDGSDAFY